MCLFNNLFGWKKPIKEEICKVDLRATHCRSRKVRVPGSDDDHATIAVSAYCIANLIAAIHTHPRNGDWWWEMQYKLREAHEAIGSPRLVDNESNLWEFSPATNVFKITSHHAGTVWIDGPPKLKQVIADEYWTCERCDYVSLDTWANCSNCHHPKS